MSALIQLIADIMTTASTLAFTMAIISKGVNILIKAFTRGELVV